MVNVGKIYHTLDGMGIGTMSDFFSFWKCNETEQDFDVKQHLWGSFFELKFTYTLWHPNILEHDMYNMKHKLSQGT